METNPHLFESPRYRSNDGSWHKDYFEAVADSEQRLTWDLAALCSILSFGYACGDHTLLQEVTRQPWMSKIGPNGEVRLEDIPPHDTYWASADVIAEKLDHLLAEEMLRVCENHADIYILLSGGLDSRIVAGVLARLIQEQRLQVRPKALTWGAPNSRDVVYASAVAEYLDFDWQNIELGPEHLYRNIDLVAKRLGNLVYPVHLHNMIWLKLLEPNAIVLAGSYGDSIGRGEFSGRHLLELAPLSPQNQFGLLKPEIFASACQTLRKSLQDLHRRSPNQPPFARYEHEMLGHYMRGLIGHAMSIVADPGYMYQMFTHPTVYTYMWSLHPARRNDQIYAELLKRLDIRLAQLPWARTNRALHGRTVGAQNNLCVEFHDYKLWISEALWPQLVELVDVEWFAATGVFDVDNIRTLLNHVQNKTENFRQYEIVTWLASLRCFAGYLDDIGKSVTLPSMSHTISNQSRHQSENPIRRLASQNKSVRRVGKVIYRAYLRRKSLLEYAPKYGG